MTIIGVLIGFIISLIISAAVIFFAAKIMGEREGFSTALFAAFIGSLLFAIVSYLIGMGLLASLIGGIAWLIALGSIYNMGWLKSFFVAVVIWFFSAIVSMVLPNLPQLV
ncbi:hypothetical protein QT06_C0001G0833 [archaeon GW2011_AR15]|nr:hypothetical protein QT06_C0001G0833 [archaeon GW2011_AR15]MBS3103388.1 hypothetical protein [Candidatus Woesearchaeota archaeon]